MQVNYFGALRITMALLPHMSAQKAAATSSTSARSVC